MNENLHMGRFISGRRKALGLTQRQLAERLNVTDKAVSKWERGQGYPDITTLNVLAEALGVTVTQLLQSGESAEEEDGPRPPEFAPNEEMQSAPGPGLPSTVVEKALLYGGQVANARSSSAKSMASAAVSVSCLVAIAACLIVDIAISGGVSWSAIPLACVVYAWGVTMPLLRMNAHRVAAGLGVATVLTLPLLWFLAQCTGEGWFWPVAVPMAGLGLAAAWALVLVLRYTRLNGFFKSAAVLVVAGVVSIGSDYLLYFAGVDRIDSWAVLSTVGISVIVVVLLVLGFARLGRK